MPNLYILTLLCVFVNVSLSAIKKDPLFIEGLLICLLADWSLGQFIYIEICIAWVHVVDNDSVILIA